MHPPLPSATSDRKAAAREGGDEDADPVEGVNEGVNEGVKILLAAIRKNPGKRTNELALLIGKSVQTVERYVKELKGAGDIEFRGAPKNGGYFVIDNEER